MRRARFKRKVRLGRPWVFDEKRSLFWILIVTVEFAGIFANHSPSIRVLSHSNFYVCAYVCKCKDRAITGGTERGHFFASDSVPSRGEERKGRTVTFFSSSSNFWWVEFYDERMMTRPSVSRVNGALLCDFVFVVSCVAFEGEDSQEAVFPSNWPPTWQIRQMPQIAQTNTFTQIWLAFR